MKKFLLSLVISLVFLTGCRTHQLEPKWAPLKAIVQTNDVPFLGENTTMCISPYLFTEDLDRWLERNPPGSVSFEALMRHEHTHAVRQENYPGGKAKWLFKYVNNKNFRLAEEKAGYREAILHYRNKGYRVVPEAYAVAMSKHYNGMVSYEDALAWVRSVLRGE